MFSVVEFTLTKEVEAVPKDWITKDGKCWWPNSRKESVVLEAIKESENPTPENFKCYPVRVLKHYSSYDIAKAKLKQAQYDSDLSSDAEYTSTPRSRSDGATVPKRRLLEVDEDIDYDREEESQSFFLPPPNVPLKPKKVRQKSKATKKVANTDLLLPTPPPFPVIPSVEMESLESTSASNSHCTRVSISENPDAEPSRPSHVLGLLKTATTSHGQLKNQLIDGQSGDEHVNIQSDRVSLPGANLDAQIQGTSSSAGFQTWTVRNITLMKAQLNQIQESLDLIVRDRASSVAAITPPVCIDEVWEMLPVQSLDQLNSLYELIQRNEKRQMLISKLSTRGGHNVSECVRRIMKQLITDNVALSFSWLGSRGGKRAFKDSVLVGIIYDAVRTNRRVIDADDKKMEDIVKDWLKNAKKRIAKAESRSSVLQQEESPEAIGSNDENDSNENN